MISTRKNTITNALEQNQNQYQEELEIKLTSHRHEIENCSLELSNQNHYKIYNSAQQKMQCATTKHQKNKKISKEAIDLMKKERKTLNRDCRIPNTKNVQSHKKSKKIQGSITRN